MDALTKKNIYLLEVVIDQVELEPDNKIDFQMMYGDTCISFKFLDHGPFSFCEEDFPPNTKRQVKGCKGCGNLKSGKSCLFSLTPKQLMAARKSFDLSVEVHKNFSETSSAHIGSSKLPLNDLFTELLKAVVKKGAPCSKTMKRCLPIMAEEKERRGFVSLYVRMSCLGKVVITGFQMNMENESVEFKAKEGRSNFKYSSKGREGQFNCPMC